MAKSKYHHQCVLRKGHLVLTSWIPEKYAVVGKHLRISEPKGGTYGCVEPASKFWDEGWVVAEVSSRMPSSEVGKKSQDYKHQRRASDI